MTTRGIDDEVRRALKEQAKKAETSVNAVLIKTLRETLGIEKRGRKHVHTDLDYLAGTWSEQGCKEFAARAVDFEVVDKRDVEMTGGISQFTSLPCRP